MTALTYPALPSENPTDSLGAPAAPPLEWVTQIPEWLFGADAHDIHIVTDPESGELGRAAGLYYAHDSCYMNDPTECWLPPASPSGNEPFYTGHVDYGADVGRVLVGSIPISGGHTDTTLAYDQAVAYRNDLPERQRLAGTLFDLVLPYDPADLEDTLADPQAAIEAGAARQAGVFLGAGTSEITIAEALTVNRSGLSGEWWPRRNFVSTAGVHIDIALDALGPVLVTRAAIPSNREGQAAAAGSHLPLVSAYSRTANGPVLGPRILTKGASPMTTTAATKAPSWNGRPVAAAAPAVDTTPVPVIQTPAPRVACAGGCDTPAAPCGSCSTEDVTEINPSSVEEEETEEETDETTATLARIEGELARSTAPTIIDPDAHVSASTRLSKKTAALSGISNQEKKSLIREAAREVLAPILEGMEEVDEVTGVYLPDFSDDEAIVNIDVREDGIWRETFWQISYTISGETITFGDEMVEQEPTFDYMPTGETVEVA